METGGEVTALFTGVMRLARRMRAERPKHVVSSGQLSVLGLLIRHGPLTPGALALMDSVHPQSMTRVLAALDRDGLVTRTKGDDDRRQVIVEITARGRAVAARDMAQRREWLAHAMDEALTPTERRLLGLAAELMEKLADV